MGHNHALESNLMDESMFDTIVENLFRLLTADLFFLKKEEGAQGTETVAAQIKST